MARIPVTLFFLVLSGSAASNSATARNNLLSISTSKRCVTNDDSIISCVVGFSPISSPSSTSSTLPFSSSSFPSSTSQLISSTSSTTRLIFVTSSTTPHPSSSSTIVSSSSSSTIVSSSSSSTIVSSSSSSSTTTAKPSSSSSIETSTATSASTPSSSTTIDGITTAPNPVSSIDGATGTPHPLVLSRATAVGVTVAIAVIAAVGLASCVYICHRHSKRKNSQHLITPLLRTVDPEINAQSSSNPWTLSKLEAPTIDIVAPPTPSEETFADTARRDSSAVLTLPDIRRSEDDFHAMATTRFDVAALPSSPSEESFIDTARPDSSAELTYPDILSLNSADDSYVLVSRGAALTETTTASGDRFGASTPRSSYEHWLDPRSRESCMTTPPPPYDG